MLRLAGPVLQSYNGSKMLKALASSLFIGFLSGAAVSFLLASLTWVSRMRLEHPGLLLGLPAAGALIALLHQRHGGGPLTDTELLRRSLTGGESPGASSRPLPLLFSPGIWASTCLTHLCGGSAGREGAAFQIAGGLVRILPSRLIVDRDLRRDLLLSTLAAGFAAALGAPVSGLVFAWEFLIKTESHPKSEFSKKWSPGKRLPLMMVFSVGAALIAAEWLGAGHLVLPKFRLETPSRAALLGVSALAIIPFTGLGLGFEGLLFLMRRFLSLRLPSPPVRGFVGGALLLAAYSLFELGEYQGLGLEPMVRAFSEPAAFHVPIVKLVLTAITLASGFKGGEFVPLFFIGATAGSALQGAGITELFPAASLEGASGLMPALGCVTVYGIASRSPVTALALAAELFGIHLLPFATLSIGGAFLLSAGIRKLTRFGI